MTRQLRPSPTCLNCGHAVATRFCPDCGQENTTYRVSLGSLVGDLFEEVFQLESRLWRTLWALVRRPGLLTVEYNAGRRVAYTAPLRLYLVASVAYFFFGSVMPHKAAADVDFDLPDVSHVDRAKVGARAPLLIPLYERVVEANKDPKGTNDRIRRTFVDYAPKIAAGLVPLFALLTWIFFRRPKRFFVEHLIFALHAHATAFALLTVALVPWWPVGTAVTIALPVLTFMAMRRVFGQSRLRTSWKFVLIGFVYLTALAFGIAAVALIGFLARA
jgi:hypothetical protein